MNPEILAKYIKDKPLTRKSADGTVEEYGKPNIELLVKLLLKCECITK